MRPRFMTCCVLAGWIVAESARSAGHAQPDARGLRPAPAQQASEHSSPDPRKPTLPELRRSWDDQRGRTVLFAFFHQPDELRCSGLSGLFHLGPDRVEIVFAAVGRERQSSRHEHAEYQVILTLQDENCRIRLDISMEALHEGRWLAIPVR